MTNIRQSTRELMHALTNGERIVCIHYSCESFHDVTDRPLAIAAIGVTELTDPTGERVSQVFSIANSSPNENLIEREKEMFARFFEYAKGLLSPRWVHWNMNNATYGFSALAARYRYLTNGDAPNVFTSDRLYDLDAIVGERHGRDFARHPKMRSLFSLNGYFMSFFKDGKDEAKAFSEGDYRLCEASSAEKSSLIGSALVAFSSGSLQTANSVGLVEFAEGQLDAVEVVKTLGERFLYVERELKHRYGKRPTLEITDEYDSQDLCRSLLRLFFDDVRPEAWAPTYAGGASRIDFLIPAFELAVELKFTRTSLNDKEIGDQLIIDRDRYAAMPNIRHLICLVFDHQGLLRNPRGLESDLARASSTESFAVTVKIYDR